MTAQKNVAILGAGITGLALAWFLKRRYGDDVAITVFEGSDRVGGWVRSCAVDGFIFEQGPRSCRRSGAGAATLELVQQLGIEDLVVTADKAVRAKFLWVDGSLQALPTGPLSLLFSPLTRGALPALWRERKVPVGSFADESVDSFFTRRLGKHVAETLIDPLTSGIFAGDTRQLSVKSCFPAVYQWEQEHGSIVKGMFARKKTKTSTGNDPFARKMQRSSLFSFKDGMETLVTEIARRLDADIFLDHKVTGLACDDGDDGVGVTVDDNTWQYDTVYSTLPAAAMSHLVKGQAPAIARAFADIPSTSVAVVNLGYRQPVLGKKGFGYLVPSKEKDTVLGGVWDSCVFPQQQASNLTRMTMMIGGEHMENFDDHSDEQFRDIALEAVERHLGVTAKPDFAMLTVARHSIPQYLVGHQQRMKNLEASVKQSLPGLVLAGHSYHGVGVNDCILNASRCANTEV